MRILHAADIHLDSPLVGLAAKAGDRADELIGATRRAFTRLVDFAIETEVSLLLIAGDLYDGDWRDFSTGLFFTSEMARLGRANIPVAVIRGNHDAESQITSRLRLPANVKVFRADRAETWVIQELGVAIHGRSFPRRDVTENIAVSYPDAKPGYLNMGLLHTAATGKLGHAPYAPCSVADLAAKEYDYWALGHVHNRTVLSTAPWIVFPGNLQGRHANETGDKGATLLTVEDGSITEVEHVSFDVVRWAQVQIDLDRCDGYERALDAISAGLSAASVEADGRILAARLRLTGATSLHRTFAGDLERTKAECLGLAEQSGADIWLERVIVETNEPELHAGPDVDAIAELLRTIDEIRADPQEMAALRSELAQALNRMPAKVRELGGLKELDDTALNQVLDGAGAALRHRFLDPT